MTTMMTIMEKKTNTMRKKSLKQRKKKRKQRNNKSKKRKNQTQIKSHLYLTQLLLLTKQLRKFPLSQLLLN